MAFEVAARINALPSSAFSTVTPAVLRLIPFSVNSTEENLSLELAATAVILRGVSALAGVALRTTPSGIFKEPLVGMESESRAVIVPLSFLTNDKP